MEDSELVQAAQSGDRNAFSELVRRHQSASLKLAIAVLGNREDAEDEVQNAMYKAFDRLSQFQQHSQFSTWLHRIVLNQSLMRRRQLRRRSILYFEPQGAGAFGEYTMELPCSHESPEEKSSREQCVRLLEQEVRRLPFVLRSARVLRDIQQLPFPSVAEELGITISAVKSRLVRARYELRTRLEQRYGALSLESR